MKTYKDIIKEITEAVEGTKDEKLKEIAFQMLLENALSDRLPTHESKHSGTETTSVSPTGSRVQNQPSVEAAREPKPKSYSHSGPYRAKAVSPDVIKAFEELDPNLPGLKKFKTLKQKVDKYIWVLEYGRRKNVKTMANNDIAYVLGEKLYEGVTEKQVNNLRQKMRDGLVTKLSLGGGKIGWKILQPGIDLMSETKEESKPDEQTDKL